LRYAENLKNASLAELDEAEADWRATVERQYEYLTEYEGVPEEDELIDDYVESVELLANNWVADKTLRQGASQGKEEGREGQGIALLTSSWPPVLTAGGYLFALRTYSVPRQIKGAYRPLGSP